LILFSIEISQWKKVSEDYESWNESYTCEFFLWKTEITFNIGISIIDFFISIATSTKNKKKTYVKIRNQKLNSYVYIYLTISATIFFVDAAECLFCYKANSSPSKKKLCI